MHKDITIPYCSGNNIYVVSNPTNEQKHMQLTGALTVGVTVNADPNRPGEKA
jgi:hypothetical protein